MKLDSDLQACARTLRSWGGGVSVEAQRKAPLLAQEESVIESWSQSSGGPSRTKPVFLDVRRGGRIAQVKGSFDAWLGAGKIRCV